MNWKLQAYIDTRIPLVLRKKNNTIYMQTQIEVATEVGLCGGDYLIMTSVSLNPKKIVGLEIIKQLRQFEEYSDLTIKQFHQIANMTIEEYDLNKSSMILEAIEAENDNDLTDNYVSCILDYNIESKRYSFVLKWVKKHSRGCYYDFAPSTGDKKILTFEPPLEFYLDQITEEELGVMALDALDRSEQMGNKVNRKKVSRKKTELLDESRISFPVPKSSHFMDDEDGGVGELYQVYSYYPTEEAQEPVAHYYLGIASELEYQIDRENVELVWTRLYGNMETFVMEEQENGIFKMRIEMRNKEHHRISYLLRQEEDLLLECTMDVKQPNRRKKLDEKLTVGFEKWAADVKWD